MNLLENPVPIFFCLGVIFGVCSLGVVARVHGWVDQSDWPAPQARFVRRLFFMVPVLGLMPLMVGFERQRDRSALFEGFMLGYLGGLLVLVALELRGKRRK